MKKSKGFLVTLLNNIDPTPVVCPDQKCNLQAWYRDDDHLQPKRIEADGIWVDRIFEHAAAETKERN